jgi:hypothetical protein
MAQGPVFKARNATCCRRTYLCEIGLANVIRTGRMTYTLVMPLANMFCYMSSPARLTIVMGSAICRQQSD